jgi:hypothetical protein
MIYCHVRRADRSGRKLRSTALEPNPSSALHRPLGSRYTSAVTVLCLQVSVAPCSGPTSCTTTAAGASHRDGMFPAARALRTGRAAGTILTWPICPQERGVLAAGRACARAWVQQQPSKRVRIQSAEGGRAAAGAFSLGSCVSACASPCSTNLWQCRMMTVFQSTFAAPREQAVFNRRTSAVPVLASQQGVLLCVRRMHQRGFV